MIQTISAVSSHVGVMAAATGTPYGILYSFFDQAIPKITDSRNQLPLVDALGKLPVYNNMASVARQRRAPHMSDDDELVDAEAGAGDDATYAALELRDMQDYLNLYVAAFIRDRELLGQVLDVFVEHGGVTVPQNVQELRLKNEDMSFQITTVSPMARYVAVSGALHRAADDVWSPALLLQDPSIFNSLRFKQLSEVVNTAGHAAWMIAQVSPELVIKSDRELKKVLTTALVSAFFASAAHNRDIVSAIVRHERAMGLMEPLFREGDFARASRICSRLGLPEYLEDNVTDVQLMSAIRAFAPPS